MGSYTKPLNLLRLARAFTEASTNHMPNIIYTNLNFKILIMKEGL